MPAAAKGSLALVSSINSASYEKGAGGSVGGFLVSLHIFRDLIVSLSFMIELTIPIH